jgi:hypothetical protein
MLEEEMMELELKLVWLETPLPLVVMTNLPDPLGPHPVSDLDQTTCPWVTEVLGQAAAKPATVSANTSGGSNDQSSSNSGSSDSSGQCGKMVSLTSPPLLYSVIWPLQNECKNKVNSMPNGDQAAHDVSAIRLTLIYCWPE